MSKAWKITITIILILIIAGAGYVAYSYYGKYSDKSKEVESLKSEITDLESEIEEESGATSSDSDECDHGLTADEETTISTWNTYTSSTYNYSFQYPSTWTLDASNPARVNVRDESEDGEGIFNVYSAEAAVMGFAEYTKDSEETVEVDCVEVTLINFSYDANGRTQVTSFDNGSTKHVTMFSYEFEGASHASDMQDLGKLILKTMELN